MKVLMLGWELPPHNSGGLGVACWQLCKALSKKGVDIEFVLPYQADHNADFMTIRHSSKAKTLTKDMYLQSYDSAGFGSQTHGMPVRMHKTHYDFIQNVAQLAEEVEHDIIHAHDWLTFRAGLRAKEVSGKPLIVHVHSIESDRAGGGSGNPLVREVEALTFLIADKVLAVSKHTKNAIMREYKIPEDKIQVVHNSYEVAETYQLQEDSSYHYIETMKSNGYKVVVNVGRLTLQKNIPSLLRAAKDVIFRDPKTLFLIVGTGEQDYELMELAADLGISQNVIFTGFLRGKQLRDAFSIGDLFVMPSISEPFGLTPIEAACYGTPSLISKQSGVAEVLKNCLKVDYWDTKDMANQITACIQNPELAATLTSNAMDEVFRLDWSDSADSVIGHYHEHKQVAL